MNSNSVPILGVIEGFFGRSWSWSERHAYATFLAQQHFDFYIYAPKSDVHLRKQWQQDWPLADKQSLTDLRQAYASANLSFGIGLSPFEIYLGDNSRLNSQRARLAQRVQQINALSPDILCLLFDDMRGDFADLAKVQIELVSEVAANSTAKRIIFCPTYYSFDPVLEKVFGKMPDHYWRDIADGLAKDIDIFWTGEKVCSTEYSAQHLAKVTETLGRKPFLWDNYPVNDGAVKSKLLHLRSVNKSHALIQQAVAGHAMNPMNQSWLSRIALSSLPHAYSQQQSYDAETSLYSICQQLCGADIAVRLIQDIPLLQDKGLGQLSAIEKNTLVNRYSAHSNNPFCAEILAWLNEEYIFDPKLFN